MTDSDIAAGAMRSTGGILMATITRHRPGFVDAGRGPVRAEFRTAADLTAIPWVAGWGDLPGFSRFSASGAGSPSPLLMAEMEGGSYWVVGYLSGPVDLPAFVHPEDKR